MKKTLFFAAVAALFTFASCQKEVDPVQNQGEDPVFTATIALQSTKTTVDAATAKVAWVNEDEITITDAASTSAKYKVSDIDKKGRATFTKVEGQPTLGAGPYTAVYGTAPEASQTYSATAPSLPMSASSSTTSLEFAVTCGLLELSLTAEESVASIEVTGTPTGGSKATYTLTCSTPVSIASGAKFFIALPAGSYTSFLINGQNGAICKKEKSGESVAIAANHITPVSFSNSLHFAVQLWKDGPYWATTNIGADTPEAYGRYFAWGDVTGQTWNPGWSGSGFADYVPYEIDSNNNLKPAYDAAVQNWGDPWRMPTSAEFTEFKNNCTATKTSLGGVSGVRFTGKGQGYTDKSIFIPYCGSSDLNGYSIEDVGSGGYCWSSTFAGNKDSYYFSISDQKITDYWRKTAMSVRPVRSYSAPTPSVLSGEFSVSATKKVKFTKGNLWWNGSEWHLEENQTDYPTSWNANHVGHFFWTQDAANSYTEDYTNPVESTSDKFFADGSDAGHMLTVDGQSGLYALSSTEWDYLFNSRTSGLHKYGVTVTEGGKNYTNCLIIAPDDYSGTALSEITDWSLSNINNLGLVCLPAGGYRSYFKGAVSFTGVGSYGRCWAATPKADNEAMALMASFDDGGAYAQFSEGRYKGFSLRLVSTVE